MAHVLVGKPLPIPAPAVSELKIPMFDLGWSELLIVGVVALIVIGPKELPGVLAHGRAVDRQGPPHGVRLPGPVQGGDA